MYLNLSLLVLIKYLISTFNMLLIFKCLHIVSFLNTQNTQNLTQNAGMPERPNGPGLGPGGLVPTGVQILLPALYF